MADRHTDDGSARTAERFVYGFSEALCYVSCSPLRVPVARVAAAQAILRQRSSAG